jgi:hypothetical protein
MVQGLVTNIYEKAWNGKTLFTLQLNDGEKYGFGDKNPGAGVGDQVQFEAEKNPKGYWQAKKGPVKVTKAPPETVSQGSTAASVGGKSAGSNEFWAKKELREVQNDHLRSLGAARNTAIEWIKFLVSTGAVKLPTKIAQQEEALNLLLNNYVELFMSEEIKRTPKDSGKAVQEAEAPAEASSNEGWQ